jgi:hypothetical protein
LVKPLADGGAVRTRPPPPANLNSPTAANQSAARPRIAGRLDFVGEIRSRKTMTMNESRQPDGSMQPPADGAGSTLSQVATERLESLDDLIFPAIDGDLEAAEASVPLWRETVAELGADAVAESRSEYLRYARSTWRFLNQQTVQQPLRMLAVLKVIGMLMGDDA